MIPLKARFRPHERLRDSAAFRRAFERKKPASDAFLIVYANRNGLGHSRLGISIGKKKVASAAERNRIKRLLREVFRLTKSELPSGVDLVIVPRGPGMTFLQVRQSFHELCRSAARRIGVGSPESGPVS
jgi:ribonuclease P protein component